MRVSDLNFFLSVFTLNPSAFNTQKKSSIDKRDLKNMHKLLSSIDTAYQRHKEAEGERK